MFTFCQSLVEGIIEKRKSQFTMLVNAEGQTGVPCHCPTTGRIGNIDGRSDPLLLCAAFFKRKQASLKTCRSCGRFFVLRIRLQDP